MLAKHIPKDPKISDSFKGLAQYIADAREEGEKLDGFWMVNCNAGESLDDLDLAILEIEATQALNQRVTGNKTYHLMVSFREGEQPSLEQCKAMEAEFAKALGFQDHQRVCGIHQNTDHRHFHIAYNKIHPDTLKCVTPFNDYKKLEGTCRALEQEYGLVVDLGMSDYDSKHGRQNDKGRLYESLTWQQSFQNYAIEHKQDLLKSIDAAKDWHGVHHALAQYDLGIKPRGNGLIIFNQAEDQQGETVKASIIDKSLAKQGLESRFGRYQSPEHADKIKAYASKPKASYKPKPITKHYATHKKFNRYLGLSRSKLVKQSLTGQAFNTWKEFLYADALNDPLAMAIIIYQKKMINTMLGLNPNFHAKSKLPPKSLDPAIAHWKAATQWIKQDQVKQWFNDDNIKASGLKQDDQGDLLIPLVDAKGQITAIKAVAQDGRVADIGDAGKSGLMHQIGFKSLEDSPPKHIIICADFARACAIHQATKTPVAVAFDDRNMDAVKTALTKEYDQANIIDDKLDRQADLKTIDIRAEFAPSLDDQAYHKDRYR